MKASLTVVSVLNIKPAKMTRQVFVRPLTNSDLDLLSYWMKSQSWKEVLDSESVDENVRSFRIC